MLEIIYFDIDHTLIDSSIIKRNCREKLISLLNITEERFIEAENEYVKKPSGFTDFNPFEYLENISKQFNEPIDNITRTYFNDSNFSNILFSETLGVLTKLKEKYVLGIYSEGFYDFQILKLHKSGILGFFNEDHIHIFRRKLTQEALDSLEKGSYIVDDNRPVINAICSTKTFKPVWINRKTSEQVEECKTIKDLNQLLDILN